MDMESSLQHLEHVDSVMLGRAVYHQPYLLRKVDGLIYQKKSSILSREQVLLAFIEYMKVQHANSVLIRSMTRHIFGLYHGQKNAKKFKRLLSGKIVKFEHLYEWLEYTDKNNDQ